MVWCNCRCGQNGPLKKFGAVGSRGSEPEGWEPGWFLWALPTILDTLGHMILENNTGPGPAPPQRHAQVGPRPRKEVA